MASKVIFRPERYQALDSGVYRARLVLISEGVGKFGQAIYKATFEILEGEYKKRRIDGIINHASNRVKGKLWMMVRALCGRAFNASEGVDLTELIGEECFINVEQKGDNANAISEYIPIGDFEGLERGRVAPEL